MSNVELDATGRRLSGVVSKGVLVGDWDEAEARLPVEELLLMVRMGVMVSGTELTTFCFGLFPANGMVSSETRPSDGGSEEISAEPCSVVDMPGPEENGKQRRELSVRSRSSALWNEQTGIVNPVVQKKSSWRAGPGPSLGLGARLVMQDSSCLLAKQEPNSQDCKAQQRRAQANGVHPACAV